MHPQKREKKLETNFGRKRGTMITLKYTSPTKKKMPCVMGKKKNSKPKAIVRNNIV